VVAFFVDGQIRAALGRRQLMSKIDQLKDHYIVVGFGRMGRALCATLHYKDVPFVLIENDDRRILEADELGYLYLRGDGMLEQTLWSAGLTRAAGLAACLPNDASNVFVTLTARGVNEQLAIVARAEAIESESKLRRAGASRVICPPVISAGRVTDMLLNPVAEEMLELDGHWPDLELSKLSLLRFPQAVGRPLSQIYQSIGSQVMIVAIVSADGTRVINPGPKVTLQAGDEIVVMGPHGSLQQTVASMRGEKAA
jgi:voltage-gated potassium channel